MFMIIYSFIEYLDVLVDTLFNNMLFINALFNTLFISALFILLRSSFHNNIKCSANAFHLRL